MRKYVILNPINNGGSGFARFDFIREKLNISINFNLPLDRYEVYIQGDMYSKFLLKEGNMGFTKFEKTLTSKELGFSPKNIVSVFVTKEGKTVLFGSLSIKEKEKSPNRWRNINDASTMPSQIKKLLDHPHAQVMSEKDVYIKERGNKFYIAIKSEFGTEPHPMLYAAHAANYVKGFWAVAFSKDTDSFEEYDINKPLPAI